MCGLQAKYGCIQGRESADVGHVQLTKLLSAEDSSYSWLWHRDRRHSVFDGGHAKGFSRSASKNVLIGTKTRYVFFDFVLLEHVHRRTGVQSYGTARNKPRCIAGAWPFADLTFFLCIHNHSPQSWETDTCLTHFVCKMHIMYKRRHIIFKM